MSQILRNIILMVLMLAASGMAIALKPTKKIADQGPKVELETLIPASFGGWRRELIASAQIVDPQQKEMIDRIYNQTLARTYRNDAGYRIMVSIAYGGDQSDAMQLHKPEVCYPAQGFELLRKSRSEIVLGGGNLPITTIDTRLGERREPVTYWTTIGDTIVQGGIEKKLTELRYGLSGSVPDGLLFRVSSIDADTTRAYQMHKVFVTELLDAVTPEQRKRLAGNLGAP